MRVSTIKAGSTDCLFTCPEDQAFQIKVEKKLQTFSMIQNLFPGVKNP